MSGRDPFFSNRKNVGLSGAVQTRRPLASLKNEDINTYIRTKHQPEEMRSFQFETPPVEKMHEPGPDPGYEGVKIHFQKNDDIGSDEQIQLDVLPDIPPTRW